MSRFLNTFKVHRQGNESDNFDELYLREDDSTVSAKDKSLLYLKKCTTLLGKGDTRHICTSINCTFNNPPQAAAGRYNCLGCGTGTYVVHPRDILHAHALPSPPRATQAEVRRGFERVQAQQLLYASFEDRRRERMVNYRTRGGVCVPERRGSEEDEGEGEDEESGREHKPLPVTPGLQKRGGSHADAGQVRPPKRDVYCPPIRPRHSSATRNLRKHELMYPIMDSSLGSARSASSAGSSSTDSESTRSPTTPDYSVDGEWYVEAKNDGLYEKDGYTQIMYGGRPYF